MPAAALLNQIRFWMTAKHATRRAIFDKVTWIAGSRSEWAVEIGCTEYAIKDALRILRKEGVIRTEKHLRDNKTVSFIRLSQWDETQPTGQAEYDQPVGSETTDLKSTTYSKRDKNGDKKEAAAIATEGSGSFDPESVASLTPQPPAPSEDLLISKLGNDTCDQTKEGIDLMAAYSVNDLLAGKVPPKKKKLVVVETATSAGDLATIFRTSWSDCYAEFLPTFGAKHMGQLNQIRLKVPAGQVGSIIDFTVRNWPLVTAQAKSAQAAFNIPELPDLGFMLRYVQSMVNAYFDFKKGQVQVATKKALQVKVTKPVPAPALPKPAVPQEQMVGLDDLEKLLFGDDSNA